MMSFGRIEFIPSRGRPALARGEPAHRSQRPAASSHNTGGDAATGVPFHSSDQCDTVP